MSNNTRYGSIFHKDNQQKLVKGGYLIINCFSSKKRSAVSEHLHARTECFFDAVIAIAITMIALEIDLPTSGIFDWKSLLILFDEITTYFISFIVLASIWGLHAQIYSTWSSLGNFLDLILNIILMFLITLFPILTKLMANNSPGTLINLLYLGCYGLMLILTLALQLLAGKSNVNQRKEEFHKITDYLKRFKKRNQNSKYKQLYSKMALAEKYMDDPTTFDLLYQEFINTLPEHIRSEIKKQRHYQQIQYHQVLIFYITAFTAISLSVLAMTINPFLCYPVILSASLIYIILGIGFKKYKNRIFIQHE